MKLFASLIVIFILSACVQKNKIPKGVLSQEQMYEVMWDMMRADAFVTNFLLKDTTINISNESTSLYEQIFKLHSITKETFKKSLSFYQSRPDLFKVVADSLRTEEKKVMELNYGGEKPDVDTLQKNSVIDTNHKKPAKLIDQ